MSLFGPPSLARTAFLDGFRIARLLRGLHLGKDELEHPTRIQVWHVIARLETARQRHPKDWLVRYMLGDWYCRANKYREALTVCQEAYKLRPNDPRSAYALATVYRIFTRARLEGFDLKELFSTQDIKFIKTSSVDFDPQASANELELLGMTVDEVAQKAMEYFEETLRLGVRKDDEKVVGMSLNKMYAEFPHLEAKAKAQRRSDTGLFGDTRKDAGGIWNEAISHYNRLRLLYSEPARYRFELGEVIRLCQWAIATNARMGDAYVLLANAYSLLDSQVQSSGLEPHYYLRWAAAILQHWADTPLSQFPFTKNASIGQTLRQGIVHQFMREKSESYERVIDQMKEWSKLYLQQAVPPASFSTIRDQLNLEPLA